MERTVLPSVLMRLSQGVLLAVASLLPLTAQASFGGTPCRDDFACHFSMWGLIVGVAGAVLVSALVFIALHPGFRRREQSILKPALLSGLFGVLAYELAAAGGAFIAAWGWMKPWDHERLPLMVFVAVYVVLAWLHVHVARRVWSD
jgi:hypothetical protein